MLRGRRGWLLLVLAALVWACNGSSTDEPSESQPKLAPDGANGNPAAPPGPEQGGTRTGNPDVPDGVQLIRSPLALDQSPDVAADQRAQLGSDQRAFAFDMYAQLSAGSAGNLFFSPYSISLALAMTYAGANGETEREMASALHFSLPEPALHAAFNAANQELQQRTTQLLNNESTGQGLQLELSNGLFVQTGVAPVPAFLDVLGLNYDAGVYALDIAADPELARMHINGWVADRTAQRIPELLPMNSLDAAVLVLVNAIYFKAAWAAGFVKEATADGVFHAQGRDVTVPMMHGGGDAYMHGDGFAALERSYISPAVRMLIVLPDEGRFAELESGLDTAALDALRMQLSSRYEMHVTMPKFQFRSHFELADKLEALGMNLAFTDRADFTGMLPGGGVQISSVVHEAFVGVDEEGTEAAAATAVVVSVTGAAAPLPSVDFVLDRPFIFAIYDEPTGEILFLGRVLDPSAQ